MLVASEALSQKIRKSKQRSKSKLAADFFYQTWLHCIMKTIYASIAEFGSKKLDSWKETNSQPHEKS